MTIMKSMQEAGMRYQSVLDGTASAVSSSSVAAASDFESTPSTDLAIAIQQVQQCLVDEEQFTNQILSARRAARVARTGANMSQHRVVAIEREVALSQTLIATEQAAATNVTNDWASLDGVEGAWTQNFTTALSDLASVQADAKTYVEGTTIFDASELNMAAKDMPTRLNRIRWMITNLQKEVLESFTFLQTAGSDLEAKFVKTQGDVTTMVTNLELEKTSASAFNLQANATLQAEENTERSLMPQRGIVEARCLEHRENVTDADAQGFTDERVKNALGRLGELWGDA